MRRWFFASIALAVVLTSVSTQADTLLTVVLSGAQDSNQALAANQTLVAALDEFEAANPGVQVQVVSAELLAPPQLTAAGVDDYLAAAQRLASRGDVVQVGGGLDAVATRAGLFLDLQPIAAGDAALGSTRALRPCVLPAM